MYQLVRRATEEMPEFTGFDVFVGISSIGLLIVYGLLEYTYTHVISTLAMVEDPYPPPTLNQTSPKDTVVNEKGQVDVPHLESGTSEPRKLVTSSLSRTLDCLFKNGASAFRCLPKYVGMTMLRSFVTGFFAWFLPDMISVFAVVLADVVLTRWHVAFIHSLISKENKKNIFKRVFAIERPCSPTMRKATISVLVCSLAESTTTFLSVNLVLAWYGEDFSQAPNLGLDNYMPLVTYLGLVGMLNFLLVIPATVSKVRVSASMFAAKNLQLQGRVSLTEPSDLPESTKFSKIRGYLFTAQQEPEEMLLPFDPTFDGMIEEGETIGVLDAWKSCNWSARCRIIKAYGIVGLLYIAKLVTIVTAVTLIAEGKPGGPHGEMTV
ncbi:hypothetical protein KEM56_001030 [Ascosphaera pollenicola]|nr:hypothetical protein KEM56_001030 [Ascosphaera pollenicola]